MNKETIQCRFKQMLLLIKIKKRMKPEMKVLVESFQIRNKISTKLSRMEEAIVN